MDEEAIKNICWEEREKEVLKSNFNDVFNFKFLVFLHRYLFDGVIDEKFLNCRIELNDKEIEEINEIFKKIKECLDNKDELSLLVSTLWDMQLFYDGNKRTLLTYVKILINQYELNYELVSENSNGSRAFALASGVNKK